MKENTDLVITGIGTILANTYDVDTFWKNVSQGNSQIDFIKRFDTTNLKAKVAATINDFDYTKYLPNLNEHFATKKYDREILMGMSALENARKDAKLLEGDVDPERIGIIGSSSRGTLSWWYRTAKKQMTERNEILLNSDDMITGLNGTSITMYAIYANIKGLVCSLSSACVGGNQAIGIAMNEIRRGAQDVMFVCGEEYPVIPPLIGLYTSEKSYVYTKEAVDPKKAMKPYDLNRDGFALGEGAVALCIERKDKAIARGAKIYCELLDHAEINEAHHATRMDMSGKPNAKMFNRLLVGMNRQAEDISYVCAHGTATKYNDLGECRILSNIYPEVSKRPPMGAIKPIFGHLFGGSGVLNIAASALMIKNQTLCPTINIEKIDPECDFDHVAEGPRKTKVKNIISFTHAHGSQSAMVGLGEVQ